MAKAKIERVWSLDEFEAGTVWILCYLCCLSFKNRAVVTQLKPWACPAPCTTLPALKLDSTSFLTSSSFLLWPYRAQNLTLHWNALKAHTWKSLAFYIYKSLSSTKCFLYFKTYTFFSIKLIQFQKDKEEKKHFSSSSLVFTWNFNLFVLWAKEINKKHDIYVHSSKREVAGSSIVYRDFGKWLSRRVNYTIHFIR